MTFAPLDLPDLDLPDAALAEADAQREANLDWTRAVCLEPEEITARAPGADPARFNLLSLPAWLAVAARAGVPAIAARPIATLEAAALMHAGTPGADAAFDAFEARVLGALGADEILRFEQAAPAEIKAALSAGRAPGRGTVVHGDGREEVFIHESRFVDTFRDLGSDTIRAYARPRVDARMIETPDGAWPMEFRAFVIEGRVTGVSLYYPQAPLPVRSGMPFAAAALRAAVQIVDTLDLLRLGVGNAALAADGGPLDPAAPRPGWMPASWGPQHLTLDFLVQMDGTPVFLEGGPGGLTAAHPCCFTPRAVPPASILKGAIFAPGGDPVPLSALS